MIIVTGTIKKILIIFPEKKGEKKGKKRKYKKKRKAKNEIKKNTI